MNQIDIANLNGNERVALMERLWRSMSSELDRRGPPEWHAREIDGRQAEWDARMTVAEDWSAARDDLRRENP